MKVVAAGVRADHEVAALTKLQALPQCRAVPLLHSASVMLMDPRTLQITAPHVAIITKLAPHPVFASVDASGRLRQATELFEVRPVTVCGG